MVVMSTINGFLAIGMAIGLDGSLFRRDGLKAIGNIIKEIIKRTHWAGKTVMWQTPLLVM